jgi:hypothetical protein
MARPAIRHPTVECQGCSGSGRVIATLSGLPPAYGVDYQIICFEPMMISKPCGRCGGRGLRQTRARVPLVISKAFQPAA